jgi:hypothetical protein
LEEEEEKVLELTDRSPGSHLHTKAKEPRPTLTGARQTETPATLAPMMTSRLPVLRDPQDLTISGDDLRAATNPPLPRAASFRGSSRLFDSSGSKRKTKRRRYKDFQPKLDMASFWDFRIIKWKENSY